MDDHENRIIEDNQKIIIYPINNCMIYSYSTINEMTNFILKYLESNKNDGYFDEIRYYFENIQYMTFYLNSAEGKEEKIKLYDPLFYLDFIRNSHENKSVIEIFAKINSNIDFSINEKKLIIRKKGYAKFYNFDGKSYQWRKIRTTNEITATKKVNFVSMNQNSNLFIK